MKRLTFLIAFIALIFAGTMSVMADSNDNKGRALTSLWKEFDQAQKSDKPKTQLEVLGRIKAEAVKQKLPWDFYEAASLSVDVRTRISWKDSKDASDDFRKDVLEYGEPIVVASYYLSRGDLSAAYRFAAENRKKLEAGRHSAFYGRLGLMSNLAYGPYLENHTRNDYEFVLWSLFARSFKDADEEVDSMAKDRYPQEAFVRFTRAQRVYDSTREDVLKAIAKDCSGKAAAMLPRELLLSLEFNRLSNDSKTSSKEFSDFHSKCKAFIDERSKFKGNEAEIAACCTGVDNLVKTLESKEIQLSVSKGELTARLRNLGKVQVQVLQDKKSVWSIMLFNKDNSFYVMDELKTQIPSTLQDGAYEIKCSSGKIVETVNYNKYTLSISTKRDARGHAVYVADYMTGEPIKACKLELVDVSDRVVAESQVELDGYTYLPASFNSLVSNKKANLSVRAVCNDGRNIRRSRSVSLDRWYTPQAVSENPGSNDFQYAEVLTDRSVYKPGETLKFKVVLYEGRYEYKASPAGKTVTVVLCDMDNKEIGRKYLSVNEFGSAAGEFALEGIEKGGMFQLHAFDGARKPLGDKSVRIDQFVLPSYELVWDKSDCFYLPGETINVSGTVKAYSGHNLSGAKVEYVVKRYWNECASGTVAVGDNGRFGINFVASDDNWAYYNIEVKVVDATGETLEFSNTAYSGKDIPLGIELTNSTKGRCSLGVTDHMASSLLGAGSAKVKINVADGDDRQLTHPSLKIEYKLRSGSKVLAGGKALPGDTVEIDMSGMPSGQYEFCAEARAKGPQGEYSSTQYLNIIKVADEDTALSFDSEAFFKEIRSDDIALQVGATNGPTWAVVELYGSGDELLEKKMVKLSGEKGKPGSLQTVRFPYKASYPSSVRLRVFWFKNAGSRSYSMYVNNEEKRSFLPIEFTRFLDTTAPGHEYTFSIRTDAGVECAATVYDVSTETVMPNRWSRVIAPGKPSPTVSYDEACGTNDSGYSISTKGMGRMVMKNSATVLNAELASVEEDAVMYEAAPVGNAMDESLSSDGNAAPAVREDFASTLAWEPFLRSDRNGVINFTFRTNDKLSRYYVQLFAHDRDMRTNVLCGEMTVTLPVKVSVVEPQGLYRGDRYVVRVSVANSCDKKVSGKLNVRLIDGDDYRNGKTIMSRNTRLSVPARGNASSSVELKAVGDISKLGMLISFDADDKQFGSDAVFVSVPVSVPVQTITEAHSAIMHPDDDRTELENMLRSMFVNSDGLEADMREISIRQLLGEALPKSIEPESDNVLALTDALYARHLLSKLGGGQFDNSEIESKIRACHNSDGGFGWFEGMKSSSVVTTVVLERFAAMGKKFDGLESAVRFLDLAQLGSARLPYWCGGIDDAKYMYVRAMYADVPFNTRGLDPERLKAFRKYAKDYLVPTDGRGLEGRILEKARRLLTLRTLMATSAGESLSKSWGVASVSKLASSLKADTESLFEYAVEHKCGGWYFPNAVMPFRGLLESELYAHSLLCDLLSTTGRRDMADGIRLWMMVQKETQQWDSDPAYIQALNSVFHGGEDILATKVMALSATVKLPFAGIQPSGNGFTLERKYFVRHEDEEWKELHDGDVLTVGDAVRADYCIWSEENRSFVRLNVPRPACLRPENQLSGRYGWWMSPLRADGWYVFTPQAYRCVKADRTEYWFDSYPEERTTISEMFFVTQEGSFQSAVPEIESLYAPHYRANAAGTAPMRAE